MRLLNLDLMKHWQNWAIVLLVLLLATFAINLVARLANPSKSE